MKVNLNYGQKFQPLYYIKHSANLVFSADKFFLHMISSSYLVIILFPISYFSDIHIYSNFTFRAANNVIKQISCMQFVPLLHD